MQSRATGQRRTTAWSYAVTPTGGSRTMVSSRLRNRFDLRRVRTVLITLDIFALGVVVCGCMPIPYPIPPLGYEPASRHNLADKVPEFIVPGHTTRSDVLFAL